MAVTPGDCEAMIEAAQKNGVALMVAYRLHFDRANLEAVRLVQDGKLGELRHFDALFGMQVREGDIRLQKKLGGGVLEDLGIYCINAARYLFRDEPLDAWACAVSRNDARFSEVDEMITAVLRFPKDRVATFTCSFGSADVASYQITGTKGTLRLDHAFEYSESMQMELKVGERTRRREFPRRDQFAPELLYFSDCILEHREPEPSGLEGLADLRIIDALRESAHRGSWVALGVLPRKRRPTMAQEIHRPPVRKRKLVHTKPPHVSP